MTILRNREPDAISFDDAAFCDADAESALLGAIMRDPESADARFDVAPPEAFYRTAHRNIASLLRSMIRRNLPIDAVTIVGEVMAHPDMYGGPAYVIGLPDKCPAAAAGDQYARIVADRWRRRELVTRCRVAMESVREVTTTPDEVVATLTAAVGCIGSSTEDDFDDWASVANDALREIEASADGDTTATGPANPLRSWGEIVPYFARGEVHVIAARPAMGKSALARAVAVGIANGTGEDVALFSLEMSPVQIAKMAIGDEASVSIADAVANRVDQDAWNRIRDGAMSVSALPIHVCRSSTLTIDDITSKAMSLSRRLGARGGKIGAVIVDYIQLVSPGQEDRGRNANDVVTRISRGLKLLARALDCPVIALSQLNRDVEKRQDRRPMMSDLRDSGAIEQDACTITFVFREHVYDKCADPAIAELIVAKCRYGRTGVVTLGFEGRFTRFFDPPAREIDIWRE